MKNHLASVMAAVTLVIATSFVAATIPARAAASNDDQLFKDAQRVFKPLPKDAAVPGLPIKPERVELGRMLFFDPRVSLDGTVSCSRCHLAALFGTDGLPKSRGAFDQLNDRRAPTIFNAALQFKVHWRGDRENVEDQARKALTFSRSFGNSDDAGAMARLKAIAGYTKLFQRAFPGEEDPVTPDNWGKAIGAYERTLITPSRFDEYLAGHTEALSKSERQGLRTFMDTGCSNCHSGVVVGGGMFRKFGVVEDYWKETGSQEPDKGRFDVTMNQADMYVFKVPGLRNVAMEPLYFHDGSVRTLPEAVRIMARVQLGKALSDQDTNTIVAFLNSLTGKLPWSFAEAPVLPAGGFSPLPGARTSSIGILRRQMFASVLFTRAPADVECFKETADQADLRLAFLTCRATVISRSYQLMEATRQRSDGGGCPNGPAARLGLPRTTAVAPIKSPGLSLFQASPTLARASRQLLGRDCFQALRKTVNRANQKTHVWAYQTNDADGYSGFGFTKIHRDDSSAASNLQDRWRRMA